MFRRREIVIAFALAFLALSGNADDDNVSEDELVPTYRSGIEKILQGVEGVVSPIITDESESNNSTGGFGEILNLFEEHVHAIVPGTVWCGGGNIASSEEDVGVFNGTDACCRTHDNCPFNIRAGKTRGVLYNDGIFTRSACICDHEFYECLKNVNTLVSNGIGSTYFNVLRPQCFANEYPIHSCAKYGSNRLLEKKCVVYSLDASQNRTLQWFDNPDY